MDPTGWTDAIRKMVEKGEIEEAAPGVYTRVVEAVTPTGGYTISKPPKLPGVSVPPPSAAALQLAQRYKQFGMKYTPAPPVGVRGTTEPRVKQPPKPALKPPAGKGGEQWCKLFEDAKKDGMAHPEKYADAMLSARESYTKLQANRSTIKRTNKVPPVYKSGRR